LVVVLRFLAVLQNEDLERDLIVECVVPALNRMQQAFEGKTDPYGEVIRALSLLFQGVSAVETAPTSAKSLSGDWSSAGVGRLREGCRDFNRQAVATQEE